MQKFSRASTRKFSGFMRENLAGLGMENLIRMQAKIQQVSM